MEQTRLPAREQQLSDVIADITRDLTHDNNNLVRMPEDFFVNTFLRFFSGEQGLHKNISPETWFNLAHGPFNEVIIINSRGEELYKVPSFYSQDAVIPLTGAGQDANMQSVTNMVITAQMYSARGAVVVDNIIANEMDKRSFMFNTNVDSSAIIDRWNEIFKRYGKPLIQQGAGASSTTVTKVDITRDSSEFDPL